MYDEDEMPDPWEHQDYFYQEPDDPYEEPFDGDEREEFFPQEEWDSTQGDDDAQA